MSDSTRRYGVLLAKDVMVPMRDGVRLATDIYRPADPDGTAAEGRFPTILWRTSYNKSKLIAFINHVGDYFTSHGYVSVIQDLRGRGQSEGTGDYHHTANPKEGIDGYDTIEWIAAQLWSNGRVGMAGSSHGGIVQTVASLTRPPHLTAIWIDVAPTNIFAHMSREGGAMALHMFGALFLHAHDAQEIRDDPQAQQEILEGMENLEQLVRWMPFKPSHTPLRRVPNLEKVLFHYYHDGCYNDFWSQPGCDQARYFDQAADVPGVFSGGWYDPFAVATTDHYVAMCRQNRSPQRLIMGPWNHRAMRAGDSHACDVDFGPEASFGDRLYDRLRLRWFDRWLKDEATGVDQELPVRIFVMGGGDGRKNQAGRLRHGGQWRYERQWPLARTRHVCYHLHAGGLLAVEEPGPSGAPSRYTFDPAHPVPTIGASESGFIEGAAHQQEPSPIAGSAGSLRRPLAARSDVLVFETEPLAHDVEITGAIDVRLWISSSALDTDFTAKLLEIYPPNEDYPRGYHMNLVDAIIRARYRDGFDQDRLMEPGQVYQVRIALPPTSNLFQAGHRIRLDIASSNFPRYDVNPNTGEPMGRHTRTLQAQNTVYHDRLRPSHAVLPIIPPG